jgi:hypothetical protein
MNQNNILQNSEYFVVLFSKYSNACKKFADTVNNGNLNLNFNYLCVDNKDVRNRILSSTDIEINQVPCLLVINEKSGSIDKYEGQDSFIWINDIIQQKQKKLLEEQMRQQAMIQQQMQQQKEIQQKLAEREVDQSVKPIKKMKASSSKKKTMIEDIDENLEDESILFGDNDGEDEIIDGDEDDMPQQVQLQPSYRDYGGGSGGGKRADNKKRENLLTAAMQMQKSREIEDKSLNPKPNQLK